MLFESSLETVSNAGIETSIFTLKNIYIPH
jgi:hypothetical protein